MDFVGDHYPPLFNQCYWIFIITVKYSISSIWGGILVFVSIMEANKSESVLLYTNE